MLKGHLTIELKNENTGEVQKVEQDNMVTTAMAKLLGIVSNMSGYNSSNYMSNILPIARHGLGGLFMFDGALEESEDNIHFPMDVHLTGSAGRVANISSKIMGSFDDNESGKTDTGYTSVWDFSTSQANGTIASLALTEYKGGEDPFANSIYYSSGTAMNDTSYPVGYDSKTGNIYFYKSGSVYKKKIFNHLITTSSPTFSEESLVKELGFTSPAYNNWNISNGYDGYLYAIYAQYHTSKSNVSIRVRRWKMDDFSFEEQSELNFSISNITNSSTSSPSYTLNERYAVSKGYLYFVSYDNKILYKVNLSNTVDVKELTFGDNLIQYIYPRYNGGLFGWLSWTGTTSSGTKQKYYSQAIIYPDGEYRYKEESTLTSCGEGNGLWGVEGDNLYNVTFRQSSYYMSYSRLYLGTICNLASPVTKTSAQSMKVTYTLTDI